MAASEPITSPRDRTLSDEDRPPSYPAIRHVFADLFGIESDILQNGARLISVLTEALRNSGFKVLNSVQHQFTDGGAGFTGVVLLAESHAALHTFPEHNYLAIDIMSCGHNDPKAVVNSIINTFSPARASIQELRRPLEC